jgi:hypothetical protein
MFGIKEGSWKDKVEGLMRKKRWLEGEGYLEKEVYDRLRRERTTDGSVSPASMETPPPAYPPRAAEKV